MLNVLAIYINFIFYCSNHVESIITYISLDAYYVCKFLRKRNDYLMNVWQIIFTQIQEVKHNFIDNKIHLFMEVLKLNQANILIIPYLYSLSFLPQVFERVKTAIRLCQNVTSMFSTICVHLRRYVCVWVSICFA